MINVSLENIILHKQFGAIELGAEKEAVMKALGEPEAWSNPEVFPKDYESILYGRFEFTFYQNRLYKFQHKHLLTSDYEFNVDFNYQNQYFQVTHWFKNPKEDLKLEKVKEWLNKRQLHYVEEPFYDSIRLLIDHQIELQFHSKLAYHKDPDEWSKYGLDELNWQLGAFYVYELK